MSQDPGQKYLNNATNFVSARHNTYPHIDPSTFNLKDKKIFITGASKGVGKAAALSYAKAGASCIAIAARSSLDAVAREVREAAKDAGRPEPQVVTIKIDVTDRASVEAAAEKVSTAFDGRLDVLINNAGYLSKFVGIAETDPDEWWIDWEVNVKGVYLTTRSFWHLLLASSTKIIINVSSIGSCMATPGSSSYSCTKLALNRFTEFLDQDHGPGKDGVVAIAMHPGGVATELAHGMPEHVHEFLIDTPELAGDTFMWLGAERREWLGGRYISAAWDMEELERRKDDILNGDLLKVRLAVNMFPS
ncbi:oxidoreductase-like protein [Phaeosphaeria sp. MPI-PUGE-AT-0046c]|nr:oxidoreductase-like protein [Phaeosphaeria sp. MPI-PUGE-AT-0046c]